MDKRPIGVFDSGMGGLTVVKEIRKLMPGESIIYFGDTGRVPYGNRGTETIIQYVKQDINFLKSNDIKAIVVACGTASAVALPAIKDSGVPIIGVVEPTAQYALNTTRNGKIGIIGTTATINSGMYQSLLCDKKGITVYEKACPLFVPLAENGYSNSEVARLIAKDYLKDIKEKGVDTLILGCTHYPLLSDAIRDIMGDGVTLINCGVPTANYIYNVLKSSDSLSEGVPSHKYYVSDMTEEFVTLARTFLGDGVEIEKTDINKY
ncbi:MAG: glutamate racemase [Clostridia bacterium]|nr:glutamate racemase [Clostridia bacterium]MBQ4543797.1 glutamate racemase [Clostridia bacterium]